MKKTAMLITGLVLILSLTACANSSSSSTSSISSSTSSISSSSSSISSDSVEQSKSPELEECLKGDFSVKKITYLDKNQGLMVKTYLNNNKLLYVKYDKSRKQGKTGDVYLYDIKNDSAIFLLTLESSNSIVKTAQAKNSSDFRILTWDKFYEFSGDKLLSEYPLPVEKKNEATIGNEKNSVIYVDRENSDLYYENKDKKELIWKSTPNTDGRLNQFGDIMKTSARARGPIINQSNSLMAFTNCWFQAKDYDDIIIYDLKTGDYTAHQIASFMYQERPQFYGDDYYLFGSMNVEPMTNTALKISQGTASVLEFPFRYGASFEGNDSSILYNDEENSLYFFDMATEATKLICTLPKKFDVIGCTATENYIYFSVSTSTYEPDYNEEAIIFANIILNRNK